MTNSDTCCNPSTSIWILAGIVTVRLINWKVKVSLEERCENHDYLYSIILHSFFRRAWTTGRSRDISAISQKQDRVIFPQCQNSKIAWHYCKTTTGTRSRGFPQRLNKNKITWHFCNGAKVWSLAISAVPEQQQYHTTILQRHNESKIMCHFHGAWIKVRSRDDTVLAQPEQDHVRFCIAWTARPRDISPVAQERGHVTFPLCVPNVGPVHRQQTPALNNTAQDIRNMHKGSET